MNARLGLHTPDGTQIAFRGVEVTARLAGLLAETLIEQRYANTTAETLEVTYTFALPVDAVLLGFAVELGERRLDGQVVPRQEAEERYEDAIEAGHSAFRLSQLDDGLYVATLGNLLPGESAVLRVRHAEALRRMAGRIRYRLPTTLAPRYGTPDHIPAWQKPESSLQARYGFNITVHLHGELARARFACPTHRVGCSMAPDTLTLTLAEADMDRDFVLDLELPEALAMAVQAPTDSGRVVTASFLPPPRARSGARRELLILLDCSGSMAGDSIRHAREGMHLALASLDADDCFNLIRFGSRAETFMHPECNALASSDRQVPRLHRATPERIAQAHAWIDASDATLGGTELARTLEYALRGTGAAGRDILLLTDGEVWSLAGTAARAQAANVRIFTVGIGSAVAEDTVRMLAEKTGGACELLTPDEAMPQRIAAHFARMRQEPVSRIDLDWGAPAQWEARPSGALFAGDTFLVHAALPASPQKAAEASAEIHAILHYRDGSQQRLSVLPQPAGELADTVIRHAAAARLPQLPEHARTDWAVQHQLVSDTTDCIIVLERSAEEQAQGLPTLQQTPQMLAAGWGGTGTVRAASFSGSICAPSMVLSASMDVSYDCGPPVYAADPGELLIEFIAKSLDDSESPLLARIAALHPQTLADLPQRLDELLALGAHPGHIAALRAFIRDHPANEVEVIQIYLRMLVQITSESPDTQALDPLFDGMNVSWDLVTEVATAVYKTIQKAGRGSAAQ